MSPEDARNEAFEVAQRAMSTSAGAALAQLGVRFAAGTDALAALVRERQDQLEAWKADDRRLAQALAAGGRLNDEQMSELRDRMTVAQQKIAAADKQLTARFPAYAELAQPRPLPLPQAQALLDDDEALVMIFSAETETFVWALVAFAGGVGARREAPQGVHRKRQAPARGAGSWRAGGLSQRNAFVRRHSGRKRRDVGAIHASSVRWLIGYGPICSRPSRM